MKKSILAIAVAMTLASGSALALGYNEASAIAGGSIGSAAINNGVSGGYGSTEAGSVSISGSHVTTRDCSYCGGGAGAVTSGSAAIGGAYSITHGSTFGTNVGVVNGSAAAYSAEAGGYADAYGHNLDMNADTSAATAGAVATGIELGPNESGYAAAGTASGAGSLSGVAGSWRMNEYDYSVREGDTSGYWRDYDLTRVEVISGEANLRGGSVSGAGSVSAGVADNGFAAAGSVAVTEGSAYGDIGADDASAEGYVDSSAGAVSGGVINGTGAGITAAGSVSGATFEAEASRYGRYTDEYAVQGWVWDLDSEYMGGTDLDINTATAEDNKFTLSGAYTAGTGDIAGGSAASSGANVLVDAVAGDNVDD